MQTTYVQLAVERVNPAKCRGLMIRGTPASTSSSPSLFLTLVRDQTYFVIFRYFTPLTLARAVCHFWKKTGQAESLPRSGTHVVRFAWVA